MFLRYLTIGAGLLFLPVLPVLAQLSAPGSSSMRYTQYAGSPAPADPVFIYCAADAGEKAHLQVIPDHGSPSYTFTWHRYNLGSAAFDIPVGQTTGLASSIDTLSSGGYRIHVDDGSWDTLYYAWVHLDIPQAEAGILDFKCPYVALEGTAAIDTFYYYNPLDGTATLLPNDVAFRWSANPPTSIPYPELEINPVTYNPPVEDTWFQIEVSDSFGCSRMSEVFYSSIHVEAGFEVDPEQGEAPLEVSFTNTSVNGFEYEWNFGDDSSSLFESPMPHTYYVPGEYTVKLTATSEEGCVDSMKYNYVIVDPSALDIPNVFTPGTDGVNDYFIVSSKSLRFLSVQVFSRSGNKVYDFSGEGQALSDWQGWDGRFNGRNYASDGVYYYIIRAIGWDDVEYAGKEYRGFLHLYRRK